MLICAIMLMMLYQHKKQSCHIFFGILKLIINKSHVVITGGVDEIRRKYGNNNVELIYTADEAVQSVPGLYTVLSDNDDSGRHTAVLSLEDGNNGNAVLADLLSKDITINSFKELVPRMNDIFIKLVTEEE